MAEVAAALGYTTEQVLEAAEAASSYEAASLDAPVSREGEEAALIDMLGDSDERYELVESRDAIAGAWSALLESSAGWSSCAS